MTYHDQSVEPGIPAHVIDPESAAEMTRLLNKSRLQTRHMGGLLPEQPDATVFQDVLDIGCGPGGWVVAQEPVTSAGRVAGRPLTMPDAPDPDVGALLPALARQAGLDIVDAWAEAPAGAGPGPVRDYLEALTEVDPGDDPVVLPALVTVVARRPPG